MKIGIVGSRTFETNQAVLTEVERYVDRLPEDTVVVSGRARGIDRAAENAAKRRGLKVDSREPDYARYGRYVAPKKRNTEIAEEVDVLVAWWDSESKTHGTEDTVKKAQSMGKPVVIIEYNNGHRSLGIHGSVPTSLIPS